MVNCLRGLDELFCPRCRLIHFGNGPDETRVARDVACSVDIAPVGGPAKRGAQIRQLAGEPVIELTLPRTVPDREELGLAVGEVSRMGGAGLGRRPAACKLLIGELADRLEHRKPGPAGRLVGDKQ
jgi:hypothetical protein